MGLLQLVYKNNVVFISTKLYKFDDLLGLKLIYPKHEVFSYRHVVPKLNL